MHTKESKGFFVGLSIGLTSLIPIFTPKQLLNTRFIFIIIIPFFITVYGLPFKRFRLSNFIMPVAISELLLGGNGHWNCIGTLSGRYLLYLILLFSWVMDLFASREKISYYYFKYYTLLIGVIVPTTWTIISIYNGGKLSDIFGDLGFFLYMLIYFPLSSFLRNVDFEWFNGFLLALFLGLSLFLSALPLFVWLKIPFINLQELYFSGNITLFPSGFPRVSFTADVFLPLCILFSLFNLYINKFVSKTYSVLNFVLFLLSFFALSLTLSRAILLSLIIILLVSLIMIPKKVFPAKIKFIFFITIFLLLSFITLYYVAPKGLYRFLLVFSGTERSNHIRAIESMELIKGWKLSPIFGNGFGINLPDGYFRNYKDPYLFELQYHALLFKSGIVGLGLFLTIPFTMLVLFKKSVKNIVTFTGKIRQKFVLLLAFDGAALSVAISGIFNPYVTNAYFIFLSAFVLALYDLIYLEIKKSGGRL